MAKNNMSFRGGLWWLRQLVGLRTLTKPRQEARHRCRNVLLALLREIIECFLDVATREPCHLAPHWMNAGELFEDLLSSGKVHQPHCRLSNTCTQTNSI